MSYGGIRTTAAARLRALNAERQSARLIETLRPEVLPAGSAYRRLSAQHGVIVFTVDSMPGQIVRAALDDEARASIRRHCQVLLDLHDDPRCQNLEPLLPAIIHAHPDGLWLVESTAPGEPGMALRKRLGSNRPTPASAVGALARLHRDTAEESVANADEVDAWVGEPLRLLRTIVRTASGARGLEAVQQYLMRELIGRSVTVSRIHGDATLGNFLFSADGERVTGIIDWEASHRGLPDVDVAHYLLTERSSTKRYELGDNAADLLRYGWASIERAVLAAYGHNSELPPEAIVLLAWLHHIRNNLRKSARYARHRWWVHSNVNGVLRAVAEERLI